MHSCPWRVNYHYLRRAVFLNEVGSKHVLHIARIEAAVGDSVGLRIDVGVVNCFLYILDAYYLRGFGGNELRYGSCSGVEVVNHLAAFQCRQIPCRRVKLVGLLAVCLVE